MSEFFDTRTATCPWCKQRFTLCEGPLCSCEEDYHDIIAEMRGDDEEYEGNCPTS